MDRISSQTTLVEQALDDAVEENARLTVQLEQLGAQHMEAAGRLRRVGESLLELERNHPELSGELETIRRYIWPSTETKEF